MAENNISSEDSIRLRRSRAAAGLWKFFRFFILAGLGFIIMYPLIYMVSCAFRDKSDMNDPTVMWITRYYTLDIIKETAAAMGFPDTLINTAVLNLGCSLVQVISCAVTGYGFARFRFRGRGLLFGIVIMMIIVPPQVISIPLYDQFRHFGIKGVAELNLIDSMAAMYLPAAAGNGIRSGLMILIFRQFFRELPRELEDAAAIDGCGAFRTFIEIMLPNSAPALLTVFLFSVVFYWNDYYVGSSFFTENQTIAIMLKNLDAQLKIELFGNASVNTGVRELIVWKEAGCLLSIVPVLLLYVIMQRYFTEGIERSGLVG